MNACLECNYNQELTYDHAKDCSNKPSTYTQAQVNDFKERLAKAVEGKYAFGENGTDANRTFWNVALQVAIDIIRNTEI